MRIYDCFTFFNELDLLEVRLNELYDTVHRFVLVEAPCTHQGNPKPLYYEDNKKRFEKFSDKIIHVVEDFHDTSPNPWAREYAQRNRILRELDHLDGQDVVIVSDLDEIPRAADLPAMYSYFTSVAPEVTYFHMRFYYYYMNCEFVHLIWERGFIAPYHLLKGLNLTQLRSSHRVLPKILKVLGKSEIVPCTKMTDADRIRDRAQHMKNNTNGWHFGYLGGVDNILEKIKAFAHTEYNTDKVCNKDFINSVMADTRGIDGKDHFQIVPIDETYPKFVRDNLESFKKKGFIKT